MRAAAALCSSSTDARNQPAAGLAWRSPPTLAGLASLPAINRRLPARHDSMRSVQKAPHRSAGAAQQALDQLAIHRILQVLRSLSQKGEEGLPIQLLGTLQNHLLILQLHLQWPPLLLPDEQPEGATPAQTRLTLLVRDRHADIIRMRRVLLGDVPDLEAQRIGTDGGWDSGICTEAVPALADIGLPPRPLLQDLLRRPGATLCDCARVPAIDAAREVELFERAVKAGLVVHLTCREVGEHVPHAPAFAVARRIPAYRVEAAEVPPHPRHLCVVVG